MRIITKKGLRKNIGQKVRIEREGIVGNEIGLEGKFKEGQLTGILQENSEGFVVKMFQTYWKLNEGLVTNHSEFMKETYLIQDRDQINLKQGPIRHYLIRLK